MHNTQSSHSAPRGLADRIQAFLGRAPLIIPFLVAMAVHRQWLAAPARRVAGDLNLWGWLEGTQHWYWHIAHDLFGGSNPFVNNFKAFPDGNNHLALHGNYGDALLAAPLQWLFDFPLSYNLAVVLFTAVNVIGLYHLVRTFGGSRVVASVASLLVVVHPFFLTQLEEGRLTQYLVGWAFLAMAESIRFMRLEQRSIAPLVIYWTATFVSFWFYGVFLSLLLLVAASVAMWGTPLKQRLPFVKAFAWTVLLCIPFGLPLLVLVVNGAGIPGVSFFELPAPDRWINTSAAIGDILAYEPTEFGPVVLPATLILAALVAVVTGMGGGRGTKAREVPALALAGLFAWALALGPYLLEAGDGGRVSTGIPLPWMALHVGLPFFSRLSYPVMVFPFLMVPVLLLGLKTLWALGRVYLPRHRAHWIAVAGLSVVVLELVLRVPPAVTADPYDIPEPYQWLSRDSSSDALLEYPFGYTDCTRVYQSVHGKCLMGTEGRFEDLRQWQPVDNVFSRQPAMDVLSDWQVGTGELELTQVDLAGLYAEGFDYLVFHPTQCGRQRPLDTEWIAETRTLLTDRLGAPVREGDGVTIFKLPGSGEQQAVCGE